MPPLISEDLDEASTTDRDTTDEPTLATPDQAPASDVEGELSNSGGGEDDVIDEGHPTDTISTTERVSSNAPNPEDSALGEQLQRSAEESLTDTEAGTEKAAQLDATEDISMADIDAEAEVEADAEEDQDAEGETDDGGEIVSGGNEANESEEQADSGEESEESRNDSESSEAESSEGDDDEEDEEDEDEDEEDEEDEPRPECLFCKSREPPSDQDEADLTCTGCGSIAHLRCAREYDAVKEEGSSWQCPDCLKKSAQSESPKEQSIRSKNSAPRLVRDLLPVTRGVQKPNSHSIFAQPLISEGEDGGRALRKRKSPTQEPPAMSEKRRRKATPRALANTTDNNTPDSKGESDRAVAHSTRRAGQKTTLPVARILQHRPFAKPPPHKFILAFRLDQSKIESILTKPPRPGKRRIARALEKKKIPRPPPPVFHPPVPKFPALPTHHLIFPSAFTDREAELNAKPYGGILSEPDAETSRSLPQLKDREIFEIARKEAEEERRKTSAAAEAEINGEIPTTATNKPKTTISGPPSKIKCIQFGKFVIDTFYAAPYPEEYSHESRLFICEFCLKYLPSEFVAYRHKLKCPAKHPPGDEIYRDGTISVWEVDGRKKTEYCQCLCLMAKMFLGSKTLYYDVEPFLFYILTEYDEFGYHFVGYFSKEKRPASQNNVSCILVMPIHQRKGYATFLIDFSYLLTRIEGKDGSPEKPLSDMGLTAYRSYWDLTISRHLMDLSLKAFSTKTLMLRTGMTADDVIHSLERLYAFTRDPVTKTYAIRYDKTLYERIVAEFEAKKHRGLKPEQLVWTPYIMGRSDQATLDGQPLHAIAPREGDEEDDEAEEEEELEAAYRETALSKDIKVKEEPEDLISLEAHLSPRSKSKSTKAFSRQQSVNETEADIKDPALVDSHGHIAPGPPSTDAMNGVVLSSDHSHSASKVNGLVNGDSEGSNNAVNVPEGERNPTEEQEATQPPAPAEEILTGYALAYRTFAIPPTRFQIEPPIPPALLRQRSTKKRNLATAFGTPTGFNGSVGRDSPTVPVAVRSSPRNATASVNGSRSGSVTGATSVLTNGNGSRSSRVASPDAVGKAPDTPVRRSGRGTGRSRLATVSVARDGTEDEDAEGETDADADADAEVDDEADTGAGKPEGEEDGNSSSHSDEDEQETEQASLAEAASSDGEEEEEGSASVSVSAEDETDEQQEDEDEDEDDGPVPYDPNDEDAEVSEDEEENNSSEEDAEEDVDDDDDDDDDGDPDVVGADLASASASGSNASEDEDAEGEDDD